MYFKLLFYITILCFLDNFSILAILLDVIRISIESICENEVESFFARYSTPGIFVCLLIRENEKNISSFYKDRFLLSSCSNRLSLFFLYHLHFAPSTERDKSILIPRELSPILPTFYRRRKKRTRLILHSVPGPVTNSLFLDIIRTFLSRKSLTGQPTQCTPILQHI